MTHNHLRTPHFFSNSKTITIIPSLQTRKFLNLTSISEFKCTKWYEAKMLFCFGTSTSMLRKKIWPSEDPKAAVQKASCFS